MNQLFFLTWQFRKETPNGLQQLFEFSTSDGQLDDGANLRISWYYDSSHQIKAKKVTSQLQRSGRYESLFSFATDLIGCSRCQFSASTLFLLYGYYNTLILICKEISSFHIIKYLKYNLLSLILKQIIFIQRVDPIFKMFERSPVGDFFVVEMWYTCDS